jgi:hypothetical protein
MKIRVLIRVLTIAVAAALAAAIPRAADATVSPQSATSENWSGYTASTSSGSAQFSSVSGSWVQPTVNCSSGSGYDAFWVGLGGTSDQNQALEQIGTQAVCGGSGSAQNFAWYELVPAGPVQLELAIHPGDHISATVTVQGTNVTVSLKNDTTGNSYSRTLQMSNPDTSTAEWIAEAPSQCDESGNCQPLPLANFGSVQFSNATATADGHTGSISAWDAQPIELQPGADFVSSGSSASQAGAQPSQLSGDGASFSVKWSGSSSSQSSAGGAYSGGGYTGGGYPGAYGGYPGGYPGAYGYGGYPGAYGYGAYGY